MDAKELSSKCVKLSLKFSGIKKHLADFERQYDTIEDHPLWIRQMLHNIEVIKRDLVSYHQDLTPHNIPLPKEEVGLIRRASHETIQLTNSIESRCKRLFNLVQRPDPTEKTIKNHAQALISELTSSLDRCDLLISQLETKLQTFGNIQANFETIEKRLLSFDDIESGDILLAFKSQHYLREHFGSRMIAIATQSNITHTMLAIRIGGTLHTLDSTLYGLTIRSGLGVNKIKLNPGEVFLVLRPRLSTSQRSRFFEVARTHLQKRYRYSYLKALGLIPSLLYRNAGRIVTGHVVDVPNIFGMRKDAVFCSEIIELIFRDLGLPLTSRSDTAMVTPRDICLSPRVTFIGFCFEQSEKSKKHIMKILADTRI